MIPVLHRVRGTDKLMCECGELRADHAEYTVDVVVTADHIAQGKPKRSFECPIALALCDMGYEEPCVGASGAIIGDHTKGTEFELRLSPEAGEFVSKFDARLPVDPGVFTFWKAQK